MQNESKVKIKLAPRAIIFLVCWLTVFCVGIFLLCTEENIISIRHGQYSITVQVRDTPNERAQGLSGVEFLPDNSGVLFVFEQDSKAGIWMKNMRIPIDIIWLDAHRQVIQILEDVQPETYPEVFYAESLARYVVEVSAGYVQKTNLTVGDTFSFHAH